MRGELKRKTTRTVHGNKVVRLRIDIPYNEVSEAERDDQDMLEWLDNNVDPDVSFQIGPFEDEYQESIDSLASKAAKVSDADGDELTSLD